MDMHQILDPVVLLSSHTPLPTHTLFASGPDGVSLCADRVGDAKVDIHTEV